MRFNAYKECTEKQLDGVAVKIGEATFFVKRWGTKESDLFLIKIRRELYGAFGNDPEYFPEVIAHWLSEYGVVNWSGVFHDEKDEELPYSKRTAREVFLNESYWLELNCELVRCAQNYENFLDDIADEDIDSIKK